MHGSDRASASRTTRTTSLPQRRWRHTHAGCTKPSAGSPFAPYGRSISRAMTCSLPQPLSRRHFPTTTASQSTTVSSPLPKGNGRTLVTWRPGSFLRPWRACRPPWRQSGAPVQVSLPASKSSRRCGKTEPRSSSPLCCQTWPEDSRRRPRFRNEEGPAAWSLTNASLKKGAEGAPADDPSPPDALKRPRDRILALREVQQRSALRETQPRRLGHRVHLKYGFRALQWPRPMMNVEPQRVRIGVECVEAVPLGEKIFERPDLCIEHRTGRGVRHDQLGGYSRRSVTTTTIANPPIPTIHVHRRAEIRQVEQRARSGDGERAPGVEAEEIYARFFIDADVGPHVELGKCRDPGQRWHASRGDVRHVERHDSKPCFPVIQLELERTGKHRREPDFVDGPVGEEQVVPGLRHDPRASRHRPRPMLDLLDGAVIEVVVLH